MINWNDPDFKYNLKYLDQIFEQFQISNQQRVNFLKLLKLLFVHIVLDLPYQIFYIQFRLLLYLQKISLHYLKLR